MVRSVMGQETKTEAMARKADEAAQRKAGEVFANSPEGLRVAARALRARAESMRDPSDRNTMLRLADDYERRATEAARSIERHRK